MKLTTLKVSVPVLMMMLFQSGYGVSDWFARACVAAINEGNTLEAQRIMVENNPSSVTMTDEANKDFVNELKTLIKESIDGFVPRGFENDGPRELFKTEAMNDMLDLQDVTADTVKNSFTKTIVDTFYANLGWLGRDPAVAKEVSDVTTVWANSAVPSLETEDFAGKVTTFLKVYENTDKTEDERREALNILLSGANLTALDGDEFNDTYTEVSSEVGEPTGQEEPTAEQKTAVHTALTTRADAVRVIPIEPNVKWLPDDLDTFSTQVTGDTAEERSNSLINLLYQDTALYLAEGPSSELPLEQQGNYGYNNSNDLAFYLNLFGHWKIGGNAPDNPQDQEAFLQSILDPIKTEVDEKRGEEGRVEWVLANEAVAQKIVSDTIYSKFGTTYEDSLRHTAADPAADLPRQTTLVNDMIKATNEAETKAAAEKVVETLDGNASSTVAQAVKDIKAVS